MDLNGGEKRIQQLFLELSREDAVRTPAFGSVLNSRSAAARVRVWSWALSGGLAMLLVAVVIALLTAGRTPKPEDDRAGAPPPQSQQATPLQAADHKLDNRKPAIVVKHRRARRTPDRLTIAVKALSTWKSPTASLMNYPGDDMLRSLPRLGESLETIKSLTTDQFN